MAEQIATQVDGTAFELRLGKLALAFVPFFFGVMTLPDRYSEPLPYRIVIFSAFFAAAWLLFHSGRRSRVAGDRGDFAAKTIAGVVVFLFALWVVVPGSILGAPTVATARDAVRSNLGLSDKMLDSRIDWQVDAADPAFAYVAADLLNSIRERGGQAPAGRDPRRANARVVVYVRHASASSGEYSVEARGAIAAADAAQCQFIVATARPTTLRSADQQLSGEIVQRAQSYIGGTDKC